MRLIIVVYTGPHHTYSSKLRLQQYKSSTRHVKRLGVQNFRLGLFLLKNDVYRVSISICVLSEERYCDSYKIALQSLSMLNVYITVSREP